MQGDLPQQLSSLGLPWHAIGLHGVRRGRRTLPETRATICAGDAGKQGSTGAMANASDARGMIAVDKMGTKVLFLDPASYETEVVLDGFPRTVHELLVVPETGLAYVPIFGDGFTAAIPIPAISCASSTSTNGLMSATSICGRASRRIR
jgi:hypothetical protein